MVRFLSGNVVVKILVACVMLHFAGLRVSAQINAPTYLIPGCMAKQFKWMFNQEWDELTGSWGDTSYVTYYYGGTAAFPAEAITKMKSDDGTMVPLWKQALTYKDGKVKTILMFSYDSTSGSFDSTSNALSVFTWSGGLISKYEEEMDLLVFGDLIDFGELGLDLKVGDAKLLYEVTVTIENGKVTGELTKVKLKVSKPELLSLLAETLESIGLPTDTNWTDTYKSTVTHGSSCQVYTNYTYDPEGGEWSITGKDSLVMDGERVFKHFTFTTGFMSEELEYEMKDSILYNTEGGISEVISFIWESDSWVTFYRQVCLYTDYPAASVRHFTGKSGSKSLKASIGMVNDLPVINFTIESRSNVLVQLFNMQGKRVGSPIRKNFGAGTHSLTLNGVSQGNYICRILTGESSVSIPFRLMR